MRAKVHDKGTDDAEDSGRGERHEGLRSKRRDDVVEKSLGTGSEDVGLTLLGVIALDDTDAAEGFGEAAGNFGIDLGALAEDGTDGLEGTLQDETETSRTTKLTIVIWTLSLMRIAEGEECSEDSAEEVDDSGADEIADAFDVGHDASDEGAGAVGVVEGYWEPADVGLDLHAQLCDEALTFFGKKLGERVGGDALNDGGERPRRRSRGAV